MGARDPKTAPKVSMSCILLSGRQGCGLSRLLRNFVRISRFQSTHEALKKGTSAHTPVLFGTLISKLVTVYSYSSPTMDDSDGAVSVTSEELARLTPGDNRELQQFIQNENQKSQVQRCKAVHQSGLPPITSSMQLKKRLWLTCGWICSRSRTYRNLLQEMHHGLDIIWQAGRQGGKLHTKLCGKVHGLQLSGTETSGASTGWTVVGFGA